MIQAIKKVAADSIILVFSPTTLSDLVNMDNNNNNNNNNN
jgi:hypothetical protein